MTFEEYINQEEVKRNYYVEIIESDCKQIIDVRPIARKLITLEVHSIDYQYILSEKDNLLRTMDKDGNPDRISCFVWKGN
jgi:hypothetical protein